MQRSQWDSVCFFNQISLICCYKFLRQLLCISILCSLFEAQACARNIVAEQCGEEIASALDGLADRMRSAFGCPTSRQRSTAYVKRQGIILWEPILYVWGIEFIELSSSRGNKL